jgi:ribokinase
MSEDQRVDGDRIGIVVIGSANADLVVPVDRRPEPGETVVGGDLRILPGGKGANQAVAAARLGGAVRFVGAVGADSHGELLRAALTTAGVDISALRRVDRPTGTAMIVLTGDGENSIIVSPGANAELTAGTIHGVGTVVDSAAVVLTCMETPRSAVAAVAARRCARFVLNLSPVIDLDDDTIAAADPLIVNEHEARQLLGYGGRLVPPESAARELAAGPARSVVVTAGAAGAVVADRSGVVPVPAPLVVPVDTTGAGDAFAGALAVRLGAGARLVDAARFAVTVATHSVTRFGAQPSYPTLRDVDPPN